ncbi:hypothetical protein [Kitasatospora sp. MAP5-34]|uniref:hypothetical protein n=1 Tax=Kitasatospora sp. MAP5-34 TaxID=3035102 RepID=UPI002475908F|nr:hypothetical protein [Kitasatospora sp. MAP5-34]MDH6574540.1 hypothetical protein [Kitasatospora sp. MAP5-34]
MSRRSNVAVLTLSLAVTIGLTGCSAVTAATKSVTSAAGSKSDMFTAPAMTQALQAIAGKVGASLMKVLEIDLTNVSMDIQAVDPAKPAEVNDFTFRDGSVQTPRPVDISGSDPGALEQNIFDSTTIKPDVLAKLIVDAAPASKIEGAQVKTLVIKRNTPFSTDMQILVNVDGTRATKQVRAKLDGTVTEIV